MNVNSTENVIELALVLEELGRASDPTPYLASMTQFAPLVGERFDPTRVGPGDFAEVVAAAGYTATPRHGAAAPEPAAEDAPDERDAELAGLKRRWQLALTAGLSLMVLMYGRGAKKKRG